MSIQDALFIARPSKTAYLQEIELIRGDVSGNKSVQLIKPADYGTVLLKENDQIFIREESEKFRSKIVNISGMIKYPGNYVIKDHETLKDIISRAGGYTDNAFPKGLIFKRLNKDENVGEQKVLQEERKRLIYEKDEKALEKSNQTQEAYKEALQFVTNEISINTNRVVIDVKNEEIVNADNILLHAGDTIVIPEIPRVVQVVGGVQQSTSFVYQSGEDYKYYVKKAGGYSKYANPKQMLVIKANGSVVQGKTVIERGDYIYIPEEVTIKKDMLAFIETVTKILANVATTIILVNTL
jgi:protein involved in polysaccharide export with SLBB domain